MLIRRIVITLFFSLFFLNDVAITLRHNAFTYIDQPAQPHSQHLILGGYRLYNTKRGHFAKQDSTTPFKGWKLANGYQYSAGNPILFSDRSGHCFTDAYSRLSALFSCQQPTPHEIDEPGDVGDEEPEVLSNEPEITGENVDFRAGPDGSWMIHVSIQGRLDHTIITRSGMTEIHHYGPNGIVQSVETHYPTQPFPEAGHLALSKVDYEDPILLRKFTVGQKVIFHITPEGIVHATDAEAGQRWFSSADKTCPTCKAASRSEFKIGMIVDDLLEIMT